MESNQIEKILFELFPEVDPEGIKSLQESAKLQRYPEKTILCKNGEMEETFYILLEGQADVYRYSEGESYLVDYLPGGSCFGEIALLLEEPRSGDVITSEPSSVLEIDRTTFSNLSAEHPLLLKAITRMILKRMLRQEERRLLQLGRHQKKIGSASIFVSYSRNDLTFTSKVTTHLKTHRFKVWLDVFELQAGGTWARQIGEALDNCQLMILILSPDSLASEKVEDEWNYFLDAKKPIIPVLFQPCTIPYRLHKLQYVDFIQFPYGSALTQLIANLTQYNLQLSEKAYFHEKP